MDPLTQRLAAFQQIDKVQWTRSRCKITAMVVGREQLETTRDKIRTERHKAGEEGLRGECRLFESLASRRAHRLQAY